MSFFVIYGHSGGALNTWKAQATSEILEACLVEASFFNHTAKFICGDLNGDFETFPQLETLCGTMGWQELNRIADTWGQPVGEHTCQTTNSNEPKIRDYIFACPLALPMVANFRVLHHDLTPTHSTLQVHIVPSKEVTMQHQSSIRKPLIDLLEASFTHRYGYAPDPPHLDMSGDIDDILADPELPEWLHDPELLRKPHPSIQKLIDNEIKNAKTTYNELWKQFVSQAANHMDAALKISEPLLKAAMQKSSMTDFWTIFWEAVEGATLTFTGEDTHATAKGYRGRGSFPVAFKEVKAPKLAEGGEDYSLHTPSWLLGVQNHLNRCKHLVENLMILHKAKAPAHKLNAIQQQSAHCTKWIIKYLEFQMEDAESFATLPPGAGQSGKDESTSLPGTHAPSTILFNPQDLRDKLAQDAIFPRIFVLRKEIAKYIKFIKAWNGHFTRQTEQQAKNRLKEKQNSIGAMCGLVKGARAAPITRLKVNTATDSDAQGPKEEVTTDPQKIDGALQKIWGKVHAGNVGPATRSNLATTFLREYGAHFAYSPEFQVPTLTSQHLAEGIDAGIDNSSGLDGICQADLQILSPLALEWLAAMLNAIERGAKWPEQMLVGRTAWLDKTEGPEPSLDPMEYRGLAILSKVYRLYAAIRLRHLQPWVKNWEHEELFAGTSAASGAEDAWFLLGINLEWARLLGLDFTGGSADIWKCFDQHQRGFLYHLLEAAGFPTPILNAYSAFHENIMYHNTIGQGLGAPHFKPCSIPQGCPFSMMLTGFSFHPWVALMKTLQVTPRGLADDLTITAIGEGHEARFKRGYEATMEYLHRMGAKPAPKKCFTFSTSPATRTKLAHHYWDVLGVQVKVVQEARDLGGHLSTRTLLGGSTLSNRIRKATSYCYRLAAMPWKKEAKQRVVETLVFPLALYGCEAAPINDADMAKLNVAVAKAVGWHTHASSNVLTTMLAAPGKNFQAQYVVLYRSYSLFRRMIFKHAGLIEKVREIYTLYQQQGMEGTLARTDSPAPLQACPPPGMGGRAQWNLAAKIKGPIGFLLARTHATAAYLNEDLIIRTNPSITIDPLHCAKQHLKLHIDDLCTIAMSKVVAHSRTYYRSFGTLDKNSYFKGMAKLPEDQREILRRAQTLGMWTDAQQGAHFEHSQEGRCIHCNKNQGTLLHLWECPALADFRTSLDPDLANLNESNMHPHLLLGVPDFIATGIDTKFHAQYPGTDEMHSTFSFEHDADADTIRKVSNICNERDGEDILQLSYRLLACTGPSQHPRVSHINDFPPTEPSAFTDGSLKHPGSRLAIGSFGTWEPNRDIAQVGPEEYDFCREVHLQDNARCSGVLMAGILKGVYSSSTRTELAAILSAISKPGGIHIALDNRAVVDRGSALINGTFSSRKPWGLLRDGDLWQAFDAAIESRGRHSIKLTWTKGHAPWKQIIGQASHANTIGNSLADRAADDGQNACGVIEENATLDFHARKLHAYQQLIARLQAYAVQIIMRDREMRKEAGLEQRAKSPQFIQAPLEASHIDFAGGECLVMHPLPPAMEDQFKQLHAFWSNTWWALGPSTKPTSWLEIFIFFRLVGGGEVQTKPHHKKNRLMCMLSNFVKHSKRMIKVCGNSFAQLITQTQKAKGFILQEYGISMHLPAIKGQLCVAKEVSHRIHTMLISIRAVKQGTHKGLLKASAAPLPRYEPWESITAKAPHPLPKILENRRNRQIDNINVRGEGGDGRDLRPSQFDLSCPSCSVVKNCAYNTLFKTAAVSLSCLNCKRNTSSTKWLCSHAIPWHTCEYHRELGMRCGNKRSKGIGMIVPDRGKAEQRLNNKLRKLGPLGSDDLRLQNTLSSNEGQCADNSPSTRHSETMANSAGSTSSQCMPNLTPSHQVKQILNLKKNKERSYGELPTPKRETVQRSQLWDLHNGNRPDNKEIGSEHPRDLCNKLSKVRPSPREPSPPAKKARVEQCASRHARACRGGCPTVWTIQQYCPDCHG
jgi:hypothetical protein